MKASEVALHGSCSSGPGGMQEEYDCNTDFRSSCQWHTHTYTHARVCICLCPTLLNTLTWNVVVIPPATAPYAFMSLFMYIQLSFHSLLPVQQQAPSYQYGQLAGFGLPGLFWLQGSQH